MSKFRALIPHLAAVAVISACIWLTLWQLNRADEKQLLLERYHNRQPVALSTLEAPLSLPQPVTVTGVWLPDRQVLLDNRIRQHQPGVEVLTPLRLVDGRIVFVQRGWTSWPARDDDLPDPRPPGSSQNQPVSLSGVLSDPPGVGIRIENRVAETLQWPLLLGWFDLSLLDNAFGPSLLPAVIQLDPTHPAHLTGDDWNVVTFGPDRHRGYALTWSTIALVVAGIWLTLSFRYFRKS